jgi:transcriptional regulator with XRE-family HTH domain
VDDTPELRRMIGARIQQARLAVGHHVKAEFCRQVGTDGPTLHRWETGQNIPEALNLYEVARVCGVSMEWLIAGQTREDSTIFAEWKDTPTGKTAPPEAMAFLQGLPLLGYRPSLAFYDLALTAWKHGLSREEAVRAAKTTARRKKNG